MQSTIKRFSAILVMVFSILCATNVAQADIAMELSGDSKEAMANYGKVAAVNSAVIGRYQFENALSYQQEIAAIRGVAVTDEVLPELKYEVLVNLINQELLYQESQQYGVSIATEEVDTAYESKKLQGNFASDEEFETALKQSNKTVEGYRDEIRQGLAIDRFIEARFTKTTEVSDSETRQYYDSNPAYFQEAEKVRLSHIMIRFEQGVDESGKKKALKKIKAAKKRLKSGEEFSIVAEELSEDENSRDRAGDLGYLSKGQTPESFETVGFSLGKDEISDVVETDSGYHIIKLTDRKEARTIGYEEVKGDIADSIRSSKVSSRVESFLIDLKNRSTIITYPIDQ